MIFVPRLFGRNWFICQKLALALFSASAAISVGNAESSAAAKLTVNSGAGSMSSSSTNTSGSFQLENLSSDGQNIVSFRIDLSTAILPDIVFDPAGTAGDPDGKDFEIDYFDGSGVPQHSFESPHDGIGSEDGYDVLRIDFDETVDFDPGQTLEFSADIDPTNVKGAPGPGPEHSASISGLELIGAMAEVTFSDGTVRSVRMGGITGTSNTNKSSVGVMAPDNLETPVTEVLGNPSPFQTSTVPVVRVTGPVGATARVWVFKSDLFVDGVAGGGYDIDPFETNKVIDYGHTTEVIGGSGFIDIDVADANVMDEGGIYQISTVMEAAGGLRSSSSNVITLEYTSGSGSQDAEDPTPPTNLTVIDVMAGAATIGWDAATDDIAVIGYEIYRDGVEIGSTAQLSFSDQALNPSTAYQYGVAAYDAAGNFSDVATISLTTPPDLTPPNPVSDLNVISGDAALQLVWTAASDDVGVVGYRVSRDDVLIATVTNSGFVDVGLTNGSEYAYEVVAFDASGNESTGATIAGTPVEGGSVGETVLRVNAGSDASFIDPFGNEWSADSGFNTGSYKSYGTTIQGTDNEELYRSRRSLGSSNPDLHYGFQLENGNYEVVLHFVEVWTGGFSAGSRVFDVFAEGNLAVDDLDIFDRAGGNTACRIEFPVTIVDGQLDLDFSRVTNHPTISGIEVSTVIPSEDPPTFQEWLLSYGLEGEELGDSDGGGLSNLSEFELDLNPTSAEDDMEFRIECSYDTESVMIQFPSLKPLGNYYLHRSSVFIDMADVANRIHTVSRSEIEAMSNQERMDYLIEDSGLSERAFYRLFFEPTSD